MCSSGWSSGHLSGHKHLQISTIGLYWGTTAQSPVPLRTTVMSKSKQTKKEVKKQPLLNPKEKKAAKEAKKHAVVSVLAR